MNRENTEGFVESNGVKIHYLSRNLDKETPYSLLFVPGVLMPAWIWQEQLDHFGKQFKVVAIDPRSQGESDQTSKGLDARSIANDIRQVVEKLHLDRLILVGWSLAVPEVVNYAVHFGDDSLKGLVLVDGLVGIDPSVSFYESTLEFWKRFESDRALQTQEFSKLIFKHPRSQEYYDKLTTAAMRTPTNLFMTLVNNYLSQDFRPILPRIQAPTLFMTVEGPRLEYMKEVSNMIPQCLLEVIPSAGHACFVDQPVVFNRLIENKFLS